LRDATITTVRLINVNTRMLKLAEHPRLQGRLLQAKFSGIGPPISDVRFHDKFRRISRRCTEAAPHSLTIASITKAWGHKPPGGRPPDGRRCPTTDQEFFLSCGPFHIWFVVCVVVAGASMALKSCLLLDRFGHKPPALAWRRGPSWTPSRLLRCSKDALLDHVIRWCAMQYWESIPDSRPLQVGTIVTRQSRKLFVSRIHNRPQSGACF